MKKAVSDRLSEMSRQFNGLAVKDIVREAKRKSSPLHAEYEWDKAKAHEIYLAQRSQQLIREWYIEQQVGNNETVRVRRMVSLAVVTDDDPDAPPRRYFPIEQVLGSPDQTRLMLMDAMRELTAFRRKYQHLATLSEVFVAIDTVRAKVGEESVAA